MARYGYSWQYNYTSAAELKRRAMENAEKAKKKGIIYTPVVIEGRKICKSWWGMAWCENLERYADYASRIERGRRYVRNGSVIDLKIESGRVSAKVQGSRKIPYSIEVAIDALSDERCKAVLDKCGKKIENLEHLVKGEFPEEMKEVFFEKDGLFPSPREIKFSCNCPDWAYMCKHVAAVLYGIGARFDENPLLFFELRGIDVNSFIGTTLHNKVDSMLQNAYSRTKRVMDDDADLTAIFGVI